MFDPIKAAMRRRALICPGCSESYYLDLARYMSDDIDEEGIREKEIRRIEKRIYHDFRLDIDKSIRQNSDGRLYLHIGARLMHRFGLRSDQVNGRSKDEILDKLILIFYGDYAHTMQQAFEEWMKYRFSIKTEEKTMLENQHEWDKFIKPNKFSKKLIIEVTAQDLNRLYDEITAGYAISAKRFVNVKSVINKVFEYYVGNGVISINPVISANSTSCYAKKFKTAPPAESYTPGEIEQLIGYFTGSENIYDQAVLLSLYLFVRVSELIPLKYSDLEDNGLWFRRTTRRYRKSSIGNDGKVSFGRIEYRTEERMKGNKDTGYRWIPLPEEAVSLVEKINQNNLGGEYLFMFRGHQISACTFNSHLKTACKALGINYHPSHQIRFTNATRLHKAGVQLEELSVMMGHSDIATTIHYLRRNEASEDTVNLTRNVLSFGKNPQKTSLNEG